MKLGLAVVAIAIAIAVNVGAQMRGPDPFKHDDGDRKNEFINIGNWNTGLVAVTERGEIWHWTGSSWSLFAISPANVKLVQAVVNDFGYIHALDDDGGVWERSYLNNGDWIRVPR